MKPGRKPLKERPLAARGQYRDARGRVRDAGPGARGRAELRHSAIEGEIDTILWVVGLAIDEIERDGLVMKTKRGGGKLNPAFSSLKDSLRLLDYIPARDLDERVDRLELNEVVARLEAIALRVTKEQ